MTKQITVPIPLEQLKAVHQVWMEFTSVLGIVESGKFDPLLEVIDPLEKRLSAVVFDEWGTLIDKAEKGGDE